MGSALCNLEEEFFKVVLSHWGDDYITLKLCQRLRLVSRGACQAVANTRPGVHISFRPTEGVLLSLHPRVDIVSSWARIVRVDVMPIYTTSIRDENLCRVLQACRDIEYLKLSNVYLSAQALARVLRAANEHRTLKHVDLRGTAEGLKGSECLCQVLPGLGNLSVLSLAENSLYGLASENLGQALRKCPNLKNLDLCANGLSDVGCGEVCKALKGAPALESLVLSVNLISHASAWDLGDLIKWSKSLRHLDLSNNILGDAGAKRIASRLKYSARLETLVLRDNIIYNFGAQALAVGLRESTTVRRVDVSMNNIGDEGIKALEQVVREAQARMCKVQVHGYQRTMDTQLPTAAADSSLWTGIDDLLDDDQGWQYEFSTLGREIADVRT